ncbi:F-box protein isoform X1 [Gossypium australe]|uniref:F-box protein isoform X1 n=1 Tax=Gossypium australe TaxID=47621 RepID=A0A5B6USZ2_9ROSI|nr:F-box protein isoform X1 [Gossypium australe]
MVVLGNRDLHILAALLLGDKISSILHSFFGWFNDLCGAYLVDYYYDIGGKRIIKFELIWLGVG